LVQRRGGGGRGRRRRLGSEDGWFEKFKKSLIRRSEWRRGSVAQEIGFLKFNLRKIKQISSMGIGLSGGRRRGRGG
jgi:hypothetical protein